MNEKSYFLMCEHEDGTITFPVFRSIGLDEKNLRLDERPCLTDERETNAIMRHMTYDVPMFERILSDGNKLTSFGYDYDEVYGLDIYSDDPSDWEVKCKVSICEFDVRRMIAVPTCVVMVHIDARSDAKFTWIIGERPRKN